MYKLKGSKKIISSDLIGEMIVELTIQNNLLLMYVKNNMQKSKQLPE